MPMSGQINHGLHARLVDSLYTEAMVMADEARAYFALQGEGERFDMPMLARIAFSCESLKVTTRLMHVIAWLMAQRAWRRGEISDEVMRDGRHCLGEAAATDAAVMTDFPVAARALVDGSADLYDRVARLEALMEEETDTPVGIGPARALLERLESVF
jgi:regulator of CtrA degradation